MKVLTKWNIPELFVVAFSFTPKILDMLKAAALGGAGAGAGSARTTGC